MVRRLQIVIKSKGALDTMSAVTYICFMASTMKGSRHSWRGTLKTTTSILYEEKDMKKGVRKLLGLLAAIMVLMATIAICVSATKPNISNTGDRWFTACLSYNLRSSASSSSSSVESVGKSYNRKSYSSSYTSGTYAYSQSTWFRLLNSDQSTNGYARCDWICPRNACYKVTSSSGLNVRDNVNGNILFSVGSGTYFQVLAVMDSTSWCRIRVRTGSHEGDIGFVSYNYIAQVNNAGS